MLLYHPFGIHIYWRFYKDLLGSESRVLTMYDYLKTKIQHSSLASTDHLKLYMLITQFKMWN